MKNAFTPFLGIKGAIKMGGIGIINWVRSHTHITSLEFCKENGRGRWTINQQFLLLQFSEETQLGWCNCWNTFLVFFFTSYWPLKGKQVAPKVITELRQNKKILFLLAFTQSFDDTSQQSFTCTAKNALFQFSHNLL